MSTPADLPLARPHVVITGLIAAGKSTVAERLARRLERVHLDSDDQIEALTGHDGGDIAEAEGVEALHSLEERVLLGSLSFPDPVVISAAASTVESPRCRDALARRAFVVWLDISAEEAHRRAGSAAHRRPIDLDDLVELARRRHPLFTDVANLRLCAVRSTDELVEAVLAGVRSTST